MMRRGSEKAVKKIPSLKSERVEVKKKGAREGTQFSAAARSVFTLSGDQKCTKLPETPRWISVEGGDSKGKKHRSPYLLVLT